MPYTLKESLDYCPRCLICGKNLNHYLECWSKFDSQNYNKQIIKLIIKDNYLISDEYEKFKIKININNNELLLDNNITIYEQLYLNNRCWTCDCAVDFHGYFKQNNIFPLLSIDEQNVKFTLNKKPVILNSNWIFLMKKI